MDVSFHHSDVVRLSNGCGVKSRPLSSCAFELFPSLIYIYPPCAKEQQWREEDPLLSRFNHVATLGFPFRRRSGHFPIFSKPESVRCMSTKCGLHAGEKYMAPRMIEFWCWFGPGTYIYTLCYSVRMKDPIVAFSEQTSWGEKKKKKESPCSLVILITDVRKRLCKFCPSWMFQKGVLHVSMFYVLLCSLGNQHSLLYLSPSK